MEKIVISVVGQDRPGLVAALSRTLFELDCNIENVSQSILQSVFGAIFIVAAPDGLTVESLQASLARTASPLALEVSVTGCPNDDTGDALPEAGDPFVITTTGPDQKGLVAATTAVMAAHGINITNLKAVFKGGDDPFDNLMIYEVTIPRHEVLPDLYRELEATAARLDLDINIQHRHIFEAMHRI